MSVQTLDSRQADAVSSGGQADEPRLIWRLKRPPLFASRSWPSSRLSFPSYSRLAEVVR